MCVDADFAGLLGQEESKSTTAAKTPLGYIITLGGVSVLLRSQLISNVCLSTLEAEYCALSDALRTRYQSVDHWLNLLVHFQLNEVH